MQPLIKLAISRLCELYSKQEIQHITRLLLEKFAGISSIQFYTNKDIKITDSQLASIYDALDRLIQQEPLQYILGETTFEGLVFKVDKRVLIPRPETEELVELAKMVLAKATTKDLKILDVCSGSGAVAISLAHFFPGATIEGWEIDPSAIQLAEANNIALSTSVTFKPVDVLTVEPIKETYSKIDLLISNPPYVCLSEQTTMKPNVLNFEPHLALFVTDEDPLVFYRHIARLGLLLLKPGGMLLVEINSNLGEETAALFREQAFSDVTLLNDMNGLNRFIKATLKVQKIL
jgi:release factor glutamine methyltransferase